MKEGRLCPYCKTVKAPTIFECECVKPKRENYGQLNTNRNNVSFTHKECSCLTGERLTDGRCSKCGGWQKLIMIL